jgi:hypothetical protein
VVVNAPEFTAELTEKRSFRFRSDKKRFDVGRTTPSFEAMLFGMNFPRGRIRRTPEIQSTATNGGRSMRVATARRGSAILIAVGLGLFAVGCKNSNTLTGLVATPTPVPSASLHGRVLGQYPRGGGIQPYSGAQISLAQGSKMFNATAASDGTYEITGLQAGAAIVIAIQAWTPDCQHVLWSSGDLSITLVPGANPLDIVMASRANLAC